MHATSRKESCEEFSEKRTTRFQSLIRTVAMAIVATDLEGRVRDVEQGCRTHLRLDGSESSRPALIFLPRFVPPQMSAVERKKLENSEQGLELVATRKTEVSRCEPLAHAAARCQRRRDRIDGYLRRYQQNAKKAEEEHARLMYAVEQAADHCDHQPERYDRYVNPAFEKVMGFSREEAVGGIHGS